MLKAPLNKELAQICYIIVTIFGDCGLINLIYLLPHSARPFQKMIILNSFSRTDFVKHLL